MVDYCNFLLLVIRTVQRAGMRTSHSASHCPSIRVLKTLTTAPTTHLSVYQRYVTTLLLTSLLCDKGITLPPEPHYQCVSMCRY